MNERFEQLARQAANGMLSYDAEGDWRLNHHEVEKFAQLIVEECINVASKYDAPKMSGPGLVIGSMIAEHFGDSK